jgi:hypothetical protein
LYLSHGTLCANESRGGAISTVYTVNTTGAVTITGTRNKTRQKITFKDGNVVLEVSNSPVAEDLPVENHFLAYYSQLAADAVCCTNLPFPRKKGPDCTSCNSHDIVGSTVACSNSNYP